LVDGNPAPDPARAQFGAWRTVRPPDAHTAMIAGGKKKPKVILVKVKRRARHQHHAGAWKLAYADFVTAMMAFFLLMWTATTFNKRQIEGVAHYFNEPLMIAARGGRHHGDQDASIQGSGTDITRQMGQVSHGHPTAASMATNGGGPQQPLVSLAGLKNSLEASIAKNNRLSQFKPQIAIATSQQGMRLQITDRRQHALFAKNSARLTPSAKAMFQALGHLLRLQPNRLSIGGHTDAAPYAGPRRDYSNWELSLDRANACRRAMLAGGLPPERILRVAGLGSAVPLFPAHPKDAANRRISITLFTVQSSRAIETPPGVMTIQESRGPSR
jgi:chemotaxis protein MotB